MAESTGESTVRVIPFNGKKNDFRMWHQKFKAHATRMGYAGILSGSKQAPPESAMLSDDAKKLARKKS